MDLRTTALIVIDVQRGFINHNSRGVVPAVVELVDGWLAGGGAVVFSRFHNPAGSPYERITGWKRLRTADEQALVDELAPYVTRAAAVIDKGESSVFTEEGIRVFRQAGWTDLVLCGIDTDACVYDSAIAAYQRGYRPWIVTDACASTGGPEYHDAALLLASRNVSKTQLITSSSILASVSGPTGACA
ncbi:cysteine hydrolase [Streptomyces armeniacus]|uniref:Cysteine hydrolase n=1 Tax=Streptomyces armeniacus TaxID=83291 RepID=A0A345Y0U0_9ACTN|nr:cysteine hydrolase [Streptomyces armeniacus]